MDRQYLGVPVGPGERGVNVQFAEIAADPLVGFLIHWLIAEEQDLVLGQRLMQLLDLTVAEWLGERNAIDHGADARRNRRDHDRRITHGFTPRRRVPRYRKPLDPDGIVRCWVWHIKSIPGLAWRPIRAGPRPASCRAGPATARP